MIEFNLIFGFMGIKCMALIRMCGGTTSERYKSTSYRYISYKTTIFKVKKVVKKTENAIIRIWI